jgi:hypothetical protein
VIRIELPTIGLGIRSACVQAARSALALVAVASLAAPAQLVATVAGADVRVDFRETTWSVRATPRQQTSVLRTWVDHKMRRIENEVLPDPDAPAGLPPIVYVQIDRIDLDTSYVLLPKDSLYGAVPFERSRENNKKTLADLAAARAAGTSPADTLPDVRVEELRSPRRIFGVMCRSFVLELKFEYRDSIPGQPGLHTQGVLTDTVWIAPPGSPFGEMMEFEREFSKATHADSLLKTMNAVELSQSRGQGLISVLRRAARKLPGFVVASHFRNVILGLPKGMSGVERLDDGSVVVQRSVRVPALMQSSMIEDQVFEVPPGYRRDVAGEGRSGAGARR